MQDSSLTDGLEAVERVRNTDKVLSIGHAAAGVIILSSLSYRGEMRGAVDQPEALIFIQQDDTWRAEISRLSAKRVQNQKVNKLIYAHLFLHRWSYVLNTYF